MAKNTGIAQFSEGKSEVFKVKPSLLVIEKNWNTRDDSSELLEHIDQLALSIAEIGVRKPIEVKLVDGKLIVRDGHCRTRATMLAIEKYKADIKTVPVISVDRYANDADLILNQVISNSGKPLTSMEEARVYKKLLDMGWNQGDIGKKVGKSNGRISQILSLLEMPAFVQAQVATGAVSASLAQQVVKSSETPAQASQVLQEAVKVAQGEGRKVRPGDLGTKNAMTIIKEVFENSNIDCSAEIMETEGVVNIVMPIEDWMKLRDLLKL
jgi:ParB/RepB/Spo0J family partition protein